MKKIIFFITQAEIGGAQKYVFDLASALKKSCEFEVLVASEESPEFAQKLSENGVKFITLRHIRRNINPFADIRSFSEIYSIIKAEKPDIVHLNSSKIGVLGSLAGSLANISKIIFTAHGWVFNEVLPWYKKAFFIFASRLAALFQTNIICVSSYDKDAALRYKITDENKLTVINNGISESEFIFLSKEEARKKLNLPKDKTIVGTIANLYKTKGIEFLVSAAKELQENRKDVLFVIIGDGPKREALELQVTSYELQGIFKLLGRKENASQYLKAFDICVLPSEKEGFPYVLLEAGLAKLPVISTNVGGIPDLLNGENSILILSRDPHQIESSVLALLQNKEKMSFISENLYKTVIQDFTFEKMYQKTLEVYENQTS